MASTAVETIREGIERLVDAQLDTLTDVELDDELVALIRERHRLDAEIARRTRRWDARTVWLSDGSRSPGARLSRDTGMARSTADHLVHAARAIESMPATAAVWSDGDLSADHVDLLRRAASGGRDELFERDETMLVGFCTTMRWAQAVKAVRYWCQRADAELSADGTPPPPESYVRMATSFQGAVSGEFVLDPIGGATVLASLNRIERELYRQDRRDGVERAKAERLAAALVEMAVRANTAPVDGLRPEPLIMILAGEASVEHLCELANGTVIDPHLVVPRLGRADVQTIVFDGAGHPITGSKQRTFRGMLRRAIQARDRHCQHPAGCDAPITECDVDHIIPYHHGGLTEEANGRIECEPHNRRADLHDKIPPPTLLDDARRRRDDDDAMDRAIRKRIDTVIAERTRPDTHPPPHAA